MEDTKELLAKCEELASLSDAASAILAKTSDSTTRQVLVAVIYTLDDEHDRILPLKE